MIQKELERAVAQTTGESQRTVRRRGFSLANANGDHSHRRHSLALECPG